MSQHNPTYASRAGQKLQAALTGFGVDVAGLVCADLGCSTGGFTDCLLQHGARHVYAVDTAYGELAWKLRQDPRVTVLERSNALHLKPLAACDLVTVDLGWTPQRLAIPAAAAWLAGQDPQQHTDQAQGKSGGNSGEDSGGDSGGDSGDISGVDSGGGRIITLIKPHYEATARALGRGQRGKLDDAQAREVADRVLQELHTTGFTTLQRILSPIRGAKGGNVEYLALLEPGTCGTQ